MQSYAYIWIQDTLTSTGKMLAQQIQKILYEMEVHCTLQGIHDFYLKQSFDSHVFLRAMLYILMLGGGTKTERSCFFFCLDKQLFPLY